jgi:pimeloyl-ACP methyl ester carboxylesterase
MPPEDFVALRNELPGEVRILDAYAQALTSPTADVRAHLASQSSSSAIRLVGHSTGGMAALEWLGSYPEEVDAVVLLDPSDPDGKKSSLVPGTIRHRAVSAVLGWAGRWPWLARALARIGRKAFWSMYTREPDHLGVSDIERVWASSRALRAVWFQVFDRFAQENRVSEFFAAGKLGPESASGQVPIRILVSEHAEPYQDSLAARLGADIIQAGGDHVFPVLRPRETAALIVEDWPSSTRDW